MSHFSVAVFTKDYGNSVEELLSPYDENLSFPHYTSREDIIAGVRKDIEEYERGTYAKYLENPAEYSKNASEAHIEYLTKEFPEKLKWSDEECYADGVKYYNAEDIMEDGSVFSTYNPNSKWDWYQTGGRFSDIVPLVGGGFADEASMEDVDIDAHDSDSYDGAFRFWKLYIDGEEPKTQKDKDAIKYAFYTKEFYTERYDNAEDYANSCSEFSFYAALLPDGRWIEPGTMGWFGVSSATADDDRRWRSIRKDILRQAKENNWYITIVDCHI